MNKRPIYICFEGLDGSGKTTLFKKIVKKLKEEGFTLCEVSPTQKCGEHDLWENILLKNDYSFAYQYQINRYYIDNRIKGLRERFFLAEKSVEIYKKIKH